MAQKFPTRIYALLIGIDKYQDATMTPLHGCVKDCQDMESWLQNTFSEHNIEKLYNEDATRAKIVEKIEGFASNPKIKRDEPILIYFAGHGAEVAPLEEWQLPSKRKIQMRIPYDFIKLHQADQPRTSGQGLLDRELAKLIADVASKKGDNIIVIFDSCKSASGTRDDDCLARGVTLPAEYAQTADLDKSTFIDEYGTDSARASSTTPTNHILLAACREDCFAFETPHGRGAFTAALTQKLREPNNAFMTYDELILGLDPTKLTPPGVKVLLQYPHCDSLHKDRFIFTIDTKDSNFQRLRSRDSQDGNTYYLWMGLTHNVRQETPVLIFRDDTISKATYIGRSSLHRVAGFQSDLTHSPREPKMFAVLGISNPVMNISISDINIKEQLNQVEWLRHLGFNIVEDDSAPLRFIFNDSGSFELKFLTPQQPQLKSISCNLSNPLSPNDPSHLSESLTSPSISESPIVNHPPSTSPSSTGEDTPAKATSKIFSLLGWVSSRFKSRPQPVRRDFGSERPGSSSEEMVEFLLPRLQQIGHFYYHLNDVADGTSTGVEIQCIVLEGSKKNGYKEKDIHPPCESGHLHVRAGDGRKFGLKITNKTGSPIYFSLFYFSGSQFRIDALYNPPTVSDGKATYCLLNGECKTIGYGTPGDQAWQFTLKNSEDADVGYLKLYWSHTHLDLLHLKRSKIVWATENRKEPVSGRDFTQDREEELGDPNDALPNAGSQNRDRDREPVQTLKIPMFQFRTLTPGACMFK